MMGFGSRLMATQMGLPPATTSQIEVDRRLEVPMSDGVRLVADRYWPRSAAEAHLVLIRSPYGRSGLWGSTARAIAERGYQVLLQSTRGTHDSDGQFEPGVAEARDGADTVRWLREQRWFPGAFVTWGSSYLGYVQWALGRTVIPEWRAAAIGVAPSDWRADYTHVKGIFALGNALLWLDGPDRLTRQDRSPPRTIWQALRRPKRLAPAFGHLPMREADALVVGRRVEYYQRWVHSTGGDAYAQQVNFRTGVANLPPVHLSAGWHDFFLRPMLRDYALLRQAGVPVRLVIGPGKHESGQSKHVSPEVFAWLAGHLEDGSGARLPQSPVRVHVMGADEWRELDDWPPPAAEPVVYHLAGSGALHPEHEATGGVTRYGYDPADPTPNVGGALPDLPFRYGPLDNRGLEARPDVLTFTSAPLTTDRDVVGAVAAELHVRSSLPHTDFYTKLCDVTPKGKSLHICDGIVRVAPGSVEADGDGVWRLVADMAGTAYRFRAGHRIRLQVSSGAHPRFTRNLGTGEPVASGTQMQVADQEVLHGGRYPSRVVLPFLEREAAPADRS